MLLIKIIQSFQLSSTFLIALTFAQVWIFVRIDEASPIALSKAFRINVIES